MIRLVVAKIARYPSFPKFVALHATAIVLVAYVASRFATMEIQGQVLALSSLFELPTAWVTILSMAHWLFYIPAFFTVQIVCAELELRLVRAQLIHGLERHDVVVSWMLQNAFLVLVGIVATIVAVLILGRSPASGSGIELGSLLSSQLGFALSGLSFLSLAVLGAVILRRPVPTLVLLIIWPLALEPLLGFGLERYGYGAVSPFLPFASISTLTPWPAPGAAFDPVAATTFAAAAYGIAAAFLAWLRLTRLDL